MGRQFSKNLNIQIILLYSVTADDILVGDFFSSVFCFSSGLMRMGLNPLVDQVPAANDKPAKIHAETSISA